jgi:hypothetical protein
MPVRSFALLVSLCANLAALTTLTVLITQRYRPREHAVSASSAALSCPEPNCPDLSCPPAPACPKAVCPTPAPPPICRASALDAAALPRFNLCDDVGDVPRISALGGPIAVHCGASVNVVGIDPITGPRRMMRIDRPAPNDKLHAVGTAVRSADISGDGLPDLLVGFAYLDDTDAPRGGALLELVQEPGGSYLAPRTLAPFTVGDLAVGHLLADAALAAAATTPAPPPTAAKSPARVDFAVLQREDARVGRINHLVILRGGPSPLRAATIKLADSARRVTACDLDLDGRDELIVTGDAHAADVLYLGPQGELRQRETLSLPDDAELTLADIDSDGHLDALFVGEQLSVMLASSSAPHLQVVSDHFEFSRLSQLDVDLDGKPELIGMHGNQLSVLRFADPRTITPSLLASYDASTITPRAFIALPSRGAAEWLAVFGTSSDAPQALDLSMTKLADLSHGLRWSPERVALPDAPLRLKWSSP